MTKNTLKNLISYITVLLFLEPPIFSYYPQLGTITKLYAFLRYAMSFFFLGVLLIVVINKIYNYSNIYLIKNKTNRKEMAILIETNNRSRNFCGILALAIILNLSLIIASFFNHTIYMTFILSCTTRVGFVAFNILMYKELHEKFLDIYAKVLTVFIFVNSLTQIFVESGFQGYGDGRVWFLGLKNTTTPYLLLDISIIALLIFLKYYNKKYLFLCGAVFICSIINRSSTGIIVVSLFVCVIISQHFIKLRKFLNRKILIISYIFLWIFFFVVIYYNHELKISAFIGGLFGKTGTFSGRVNVWQQAISFFKYNYYWGAGIGLEFHPWSDPANVVYSAHNSLLEFLSKFGIFSGCIFAVLVTMVFIKSIKVRNKKISLLLSSAFLLMFLSMQFEALGNNYIFWVQSALPYMLYDKNIKRINLRSNL